MILTKHQNSFFNRNTELTLKWDHIEILTSLNKIRFSQSLKLKINVYKMDYSQKIKMENYPIVMKWKINV